MLKRVLKNFGVVLRGRGIAAVFSVSATGLMANALSATDFGLVVLIHTYIMVVRGTLDFRTFDAIVRFGIPLNDSADRAGLRSLLRSTMVIDLSSTLLATILAVAAVPLAGHFLHWDSQMMSWAAAYSRCQGERAGGGAVKPLAVMARVEAFHRR